METERPITEMTPVWCFIGFSYSPVIISMNSKNEIKNKLSIGTTVLIII